MSLRKKIWNCDNLPDVIERRRMKHEENCERYFKKV